MAAALILLSVLAQSDESEWAPPPAPQPPPPVEVMEEPPVPSPPAAKTQAEKPAPAPVPAPDPRRFNWGHVALALMGTAGQSGYFAVRIEAGAVFGFPRRMKDTVNRATGLTIGLALDLLAAKLRVDSCGASGLCGSRYQGGVALRGAWNWGVIGSDGVVAPIHSAFVQAVGFLSSNSVPSAPLAPGADWGEHGVRFDVGFTSGFLRGSAWPKEGSFVIGGGLYGALSLEWLITPTAETGRFRGGLSLGIGI